jgi:hypothetical protein
MATFSYNGPNTLGGVQVVYMVYRTNRSDHPGSATMDRRYITSSAGTFSEVLRSGLSAHFAFRIHE